MKKEKLPIFIFTLIVLSVACNSKKNETPNNFFPVISFLNSQVAHVDTSLYTIRKLIYIDSSRTDTLYFPREEFRELATDFLQLPDLSLPKYTDRYKEEKTYDETMNRVILSYKPINPEKETLQRQDILIQPDPSGDRITSIIIDYYLNSKDSSVEKKLLWQADRSFQVTATRQLPAKPVAMTRFKVTWNEDNQE